MPTTEDQGLFADYLARRKAEEAEAAAPLAPVAAVPADPTVREGLARMLRPRRRTQTLPSLFLHIFCTGMYPHGRACARKPSTC